ncbi:MAG: alpha/beta hydrolase, partial [Cyanobacteria bacterium P01_H01_bin.121]
GSVESAAHSVHDAHAYTMESYAADLLHLLDKLQLQNVFLNAHSMGASIATLLVNQASSRIERVILTCSGIFVYNKLTFNAFHRAGSLVVKLRPRWLAQLPLADRMFMARFLHRPIPAGERQAFLEDYLVASPSAATGTIYTAVSQHAATVMPNAFETLQVPTLLISGKCDQIIPVRLGRAAATLNPDQIQHQVIDRTGHFPMLEDPKTYLQCLAKFLEIPALVTI